MAEDAADGEGATENEADVGNDELHKTCGGRAPGRGARSRAPSHFG
jgi:hypothetical protein